MKMNLGGLSSVVVIVATVTGVNTVRADTVSSRLRPPPPPSRRVTSPTPTRALGCFKSRRVVVRLPSGTEVRGYLLRVDKRRIALGLPGNQIRFLPLGGLTSVREVAAGGSSAPRYQWRRGTPLKGRCNVTLVRRMHRGSVRPVVTEDNRTRYSGRSKDHKLLASAKPLKTWSYVLGIGGGLGTAGGLLMAYGLGLGKRSDAGAIAGIALFGTGVVSCVIGSALSLVSAVRRSVARGGPRAESRRRDWLYGGIAVTSIGLAAVAGGSGLLFANQVRRIGDGMDVGGALLITAGLLVATGVGLPMWIEAWRLRSRASPTPSASPAAAATEKSARRMSSLDSLHERRLQAHLRLNHPPARMFSAQLIF